MRVFHVLATRRLAGLSYHWRKTALKGPATEVPCIYVFTGPSDIVDKTQQRLAELKIQAVKQTSAEAKTARVMLVTLHDAKVNNDAVDFGLRCCLPLHISHSSKQLIAQSFVRLMPSP